MLENVEVLDCGGPEARRTPAFGELAAEGKYLRCAPVVSMLPNSTLRSQGSPRGEADRGDAQTKNSKSFSLSNEICGRCLRGSVWVRAVRLVFHVADTCRIAEADAFGSAHRPRSCRMPIVCSLMLPRGEAARGNAQNSKADFADSKGPT